MTEPKPLRAELLKVAKRMGIDDPESAAEIFSHWEEIAGGKFSSNLHPESLKEGVLQLTTDSTAWAAEVRWLGPKVADAINERLGRKAVVQVVARVRRNREESAPPKSRKNRLPPGKIARRN